MSDTQRMEVLEEAVRRLLREVERLSREVDALRAASPVASGATHDARSGSVTNRPDQPQPPVPRTPDGVSSRAAPREPALGLETLIGRYGTLALAALTILLGVGVFLSWAVEHVTIGPRMRVILGVLAASAVAVVGLGLRRRGVRRFGNVLLGLSLAITHVVAWGAGPFLHVVTPATALAGAALASAALAALAWQENEEALFAVGCGGALLAPFVTADEGARVFHLLTFGLLVLGTSMLAIRDRSWRIAARIVSAGAALYVIAGLGAMDPGAPAERVAPAAFALACAWFALVLTAHPHRVWIGRATCALAVLALFAAATSGSETQKPDVIAAALVATLTTNAVLTAGRDSREWNVAPLGVLFPLGALAAALLALADPVSPAGAAIAAAWAGVATAGAWLESRRSGAQPAPGQDTEPDLIGASHNERFRDVHLAVVALAGATALVLALMDQPHWCVIALSAWSVGLAWLDRELDSPGLAAGIAVVLLVATPWALVLLGERVAYAYTPFLTGASAAALAVVAAWAAFASSRRGDARSGGVPAGVASIRLIAPAAAIGWGYLELARAFSADIATFLVIFYLAAVGIVAILFGRARRLAIVRHTGLALAMLGGVMALLQASTLTFGLRLASYLVVGMFLLGVAYLYRAGNEAGERA